MAFGEHGIRIDNFNQDGFIEVPNSYRLYSSPVGVKSSPNLRKRRRCLRNRAAAALAQSKVGEERGGDAMIGILSKIPSKRDI